MRKTFRKGDTIVISKDYGTRNPLNWSEIKNYPYAVINNARDSYSLHVEVTLPNGKHITTWLNRSHSKHIPKKLLELKEAML